MNTVISSEAELCVVAGLWNIVHWHSCANTEIGGVFLYAPAPFATPRYFTLSRVMDLKVPTEPIKGLKRKSLWSVNLFDLQNSPNRAANNIQIMDRHGDLDLYEKDLTMLRMFLD